MHSKYFLLCWHMVTVFVLRYCVDTCVGWYCWYMLVDIVLSIVSIAVLSFHRWYCADIIALVYCEYCVYWIIFRWYSVDDIILQNCTDILWYENKKTEAARDNGGQILCGAFLLLCWHCFSKFWMTVSIIYFLSFCITLAMQIMIIQQTVGRSEKYKSFQKAKEDFELGHITDFRTVSKSLSDKYISFYYIRQTYFTEGGARFEITPCPNFRSFSWQLELKPYFSEIRQKYFTLSSTFIEPIRHTFLKFRLNWMWKWKAVGLLSIWYFR